MKKIDKYDEFQTFHEQVLNNNNILSGFSRNVTRVKA